LYSAAASAEATTGKLRSYTEVHYALDILACGDRTHWWTERTNTWDGDRTHQKQPSICIHWWHITPSLCVTSQHHQEFIFLRW